MKVRTNWLIVKYNGAFHSSSGQTCYCTVLMEEQQAHIGSEATVPNRFVCPLPVWLPNTYAGFGQHKLWNSKSIILSSASLAHCVSVCVCLSCTLPHTYQFARMKNVKGRPPGYSMPGQRKIFPSSSMRRSVRSVLCPTHISRPLDRHVLGRLQGSACCSAH